jgi:hypothetical protein
VVSQITSDRRDTTVSIFLVITPADYLTAETTMSCPDATVVDTMQWRAVLLDQGESAYTFGALASVIADFGDISTEANNLGEPAWGDLLARVEIAGYDHNDDVFFTQLILYGLWMNCTYMPPQTGRSLDVLLNGRISENNPQATDAESGAAPPGLRTTSDHG